jgi:hypothetical protein
VNPNFIDLIANSFMIALPPGESRGATPGEKPAAGMSGSPVFVHRNGKRIFGGILFATVQIPDEENNRTVDVGFFHGIDEIRKENQGQVAKVSL